jgi:hypothetical protein
MTCRKMDGMLISASGGAELPEEAREHIESCPGCRALIAALSSAHAPQPVETAVLDRIRQPAISMLTPVRPLAPVGVFVAAFVIIFGVIAVAGALRLGVYGLPALTLIQRVAIFPVLMALAVLTAFAAARRMRPGARTIGSGVVFTVSLIAIEAVFLSLFHDYSVGRFLRWGTGCLRAGLLCAVPTALLVWLLVRRGYIVAPVSTGAAIGSVAGMTGLTALELHCPILTIPHVAIWHVGVLVVSIGAGAMAGWLARSR